MTSLSLLATGRLLLEAVDGTPTEIHPLWLRERSTSPAARDGKTGQRLYNPSTLDPDLTATLVERCETGWRIGFSDGHRADYGEAKLLADLATVTGDDVVPAPVCWDATSRPLPEFAWDACASDRDLLPALAVFLRLGFILFHDVPRESGAVLAVARRFGYPRETNFGMLFDVRSVPDASDLAYTSLPLEPHTDNPYRAPAPGIQLLHCLVNETAGGMSTLVDGRAVASALKEEDEAAFRLLAATPIRFSYTDDTTALTAWAPLIRLGPDGMADELHVSPRLDFVPLMPPGELDRFYRARRKFDTMLRSPRFERRFRLAPGDLVMFDNGRCLHGRTGFSTSKGQRHLQGCYIDQDGPRSLYRVLSRAA